MATKLQLPVTAGIVRDVADVFLKMLDPPKHKPKEPCPIVRAVNWQYADVHIYIFKGEQIECSVAERYR